MSTNTVIVGDMNINVDNPCCHFVVGFLSLIEFLGLKQHVDVPTHTRWRTLELVITDSAPINNLQVYDLGVSNHKVVSMALTFLSPPTKLRRPMLFRN